MKKEIIYHANGENSGTYGPLCFKENFTEDINEKTEKFVSWDCNIYQTVDKYKVRAVEIPNWMNEQFFLNNYIEYKYIIGLTEFNPDELTEVQYKNLCKLGEKYKFFIGWILKKNSKNTFINSIQDQIKTWLNNPDNQYGQPLSQRQFEAASKFCPLYEAKQISSYLYRHS